MKRVNPKAALERITTVTRVWSSLRPNSSFYGRTLDQFKAEIKPSLDARAELDVMDEHRGATAVRRDDADEVSMDLIKHVVNAVKADPNEGENGEVYAALGYVRKGLRTNGRSRQRSVEGEQATAPATTPEEVKAEKDVA